MPQKWRQTCLFLIFFEICYSVAIRGPPKLHHENHLITAEEGHAVKLPCPITANPEPLFEWTKDGRRVDDTWPRYVVRRHFLRIKSAREEDAGDFTCTGINGFGQETFTFSLLIYRDNLPPPSARRAPIFTEVSPSSPFITSVGDALTLMCKAEGIPSPKISWRKDGVLLHKTGSKLHRSIQSILDTGIYTCLATNPLAIKTHNFTIIVEEKTYDEPEIVRASNASVVQGTNASLHCVVKSFLQPQIQWLKLVTPSEAASLPKSAGNATLHRNGQTYRYISSLSSRVERVNDSFRSTLFIQSASSSHAGVYICVGATRNGYNFREVHLTITSKTAKEENKNKNKVSETSISDPDITTTPQSLLLIVLVPIAALIMLISLAILICMMRRRHARLRKSHPSGSQNTSLDNEDQKMGTPLHSFLPTKVLSSLPPDLVFQVHQNYIMKTTL